MEIIGCYKAREGSGEKLIHAPDGANGEYLLHIYEDGHFSFFPSNGQGLLPSKGVQWIVSDSNGDGSVTFVDEKKAIYYKESMERLNGKVYRMKKIFPSAGIKTLGDPLC